MLSHSSFDLHFSNTQWCWAFFHGMLAFCVPSWEKCLFRFFLGGLLVFLLFNCISYLCILDIKPLSVASFETIFSHSLSCLFFMVFFALQNLVSLIRSHWFIFVFISVALGIWLKHLCGWYQRMFCLCFLPGVWWCLTSKSLSHFVFIFGHDVRVCSSFIDFIDLHVVVQFFPALYAEKTIFFPFYILASFFKDYLSVGVWVYFQSSLFCSIGLYVCFGTSITLSWALCLCNIAWSLGELWRLLGNSGSFMVPYKFLYCIF